MQLTTDIFLLHEILHVFPTRFYYPLVHIPTQEIFLLKLNILVFWFIFMQQLRDSAFYSNFIDINLTLFCYCNNICYSHSFNHIFMTLLLLYYYLWLLVVTKFGLCRLSQIEDLKIFIYRPLHNTSIGSTATRCSLAKPPYSVFRFVNLGLRFWTTFQENDV